MTTPLQDRPPAYPHVAVPCQAHQRARGTRGGAAQCEPAPRSASVPLRRSTVTAEPVDAEVPPIVHDVLRSPGRPLDDATRAYMEPLFGHDFSAVRIHDDADAAASAREVDAAAYTVGHHIAFDADRYTPGGPGRSLVLAHELAHVAQQGRTPTGWTRPLAVGPVDDPAEDAARVTARDALAGNIPSTSTNVSTRPVLRRFSESEHRSIGEGAYRRAFGETQSGGRGGVTPPVNDAIAARLKQFSFSPGDGPSYDYGQMVAIADNIASFDLLEQKAARSRGTGIPLLSPVWERIGDATHYLDLAARNTAHFHPHNYLSWQPWHWQALWTMHRAWELGEEADRLKREVHSLLSRFGAVRDRARAVLTAADGTARSTRTDANVDGHLAEMERILSQASQRQQQYQQARALASETAVRAMAMNGFGDHFLTDAFAAGHIVTPRRELLSEYSTQLLGFIPVGGVLNCANIPSLAWHDLDNAFGVEVSNADGQTWKTYGDDYADTDAAPGGKSYSPTMEHVVEATSRSIKQMWQAARGQQPADLLPVLNQLPRPRLEHYPTWTPRDWNLQLRYAAGERLGVPPDLMSSSTPRVDEQPPNPKGNQIGSGLLSARATCVNVLSQFTYRDFVVPMVERIRTDYDKRYFTGREEQILPPSTVAAPQASVTGQVVLGSVIGAAAGLLGGVTIGAMLSGLVGGLLGAGIGLLGGLLVGGLVGGFHGKRRDRL